MHAFKNKFEIMHKDVLVKQKEASRLADKAYTDKERCYYQGKERAYREIIIELDHICGLLTHWT